MGFDRARPLALLGCCLLVALAATAGVAVHAETLVYKAENKWVAPENNKPLLNLMKQARGGKTAYKVKLPKENRQLAVVRLEVVSNILSREAKTAVVIEEAGGVAAANTLVIE